jgi:hypothetical protein
MRIPCKCLLFTGFAASAIFAQNYNGGVAKGWVKATDQGTRCGPDETPVSNALVLATHSLFAMQSSTRSMDGWFIFTPLQISNESWKIQTFYQRRRQVDPQPTDFLARANMSDYVNKPTICLGDEKPLLPPRRVSFLWTGPVALQGFGWAGEQDPGQPASPPLDIVSGKVTTVSRRGERVVVRLYGIRLSDAGMFRLGRVEPGPGGEFRIPLAPLASAKYDYLYLLALGPGDTQFSELLRQDELGQPIDVSLVALQPRNLVPPVPEPARGIVFPPELIRSLPLSGSRNVDNLLLLAPGVYPGAETTDLSGPGITGGFGTSGELSVNGQSGRQNNFVLDGADNTDESTGVYRQGLVFPSPVPVEAVMELQIMAGSADARFGRASAAQINVLSAIGGRAFHGTAYGYLTDRRFNARNFFDSAPSSRPVALTREPDVSGENGLHATGARDQGVPVRLNGAPLVLDNPVQTDPPSTHMQAGLAIGGPLALHEDREPRTFFFGAFENQRTRAASESHFAVPTVRQRGFNAGSNANRGDSGITGINGVRLYPSTLAGDAIFSLYPFPNQPSGPFGANTYAAVLPADADGRLYSLKLDRYLHLFRASHVLTARYGHTGESSDIPALGGALFASARARVRTDSIAVLFDTNFAAKWASSARFGWESAAYSFDELRSPLQSASTLFPSQQFLLNRPLLLNTSTSGAAEFQNASRLSANPAVGTNTQTEEITGAIGRVNLPGFSSIGADTFHFPQHKNTGTFQWAETVTRVTGRNSLWLGFEIWHLLVDSALQRNARPELTFPGQVLPTLPPAFPGAPPPPVSGLLNPTDLVAAGLLPSYQQTLAARPDTALDLRRYQADFFFQDDFRLAPWLTLNVGGRFQLLKLPESDDGRFEQAPGSAPFSTNVNAFQADFRAGLAWDPFGDGSPIRLSFGRFTGRLSAAILEESRNTFPRLPIDVSSSCDCGIPGPVGILRDPSFLNILSPSAAQNPAAALAQASPGANLQFVQPSPNLAPPTTMQFNLGIQHRLPGDSVFSVAYVGAMGDGLLRVRDENALATPGFAVLSIVPLSGPIPDFFSLRVPRTAGSVNVSRLLFESNGKSRFDSLQAEYRGTINRAFQFGAAFTWAHSIDDSSDFFDTAGAFALPQNNVHPSERGSSSFDVRLRGTGYFVWDLPGFSKRALVNGWQLAGIVTAQTGQPFTVNSAFDINGDGLLTDRLATTNGLIGPAVGTAVPNAGRTTVLALAPGVSPAALLARSGDEGAVGRNTFRAGGIATIDLALSKTFALKERYRLAWKIESFNTANRANFGVPVRILEGPAFGQAVRTIIPARTLQIAGTFAF